MLVDTHAHLWWESYKDDLDEVVARARVAGVEKIIVPGTNIASSKQAIELAKNYPKFIYAAAGIHPEEIVDQESSDLSFATLQTALRSELWGQVVAVGEIGTDASTKEMQGCMSAQMVLFRSQCELALELDLPVIIHTRNSFAETWEVLQSLSAMPRGQFHCFSVDEVALTQVLSAGFCVSFCGNIAWSKRVAKLVPLVPRDRLLLETDSPFMTPRVAKVPNSGPESSEPRATRNEPANVRINAELIASLRGESLQVLGQQTTENAKRLFHL